MKEKKPVGPHKLLKICRRLFFSGALTMLAAAYLIGESYQWRGNDVSVFLWIAAGVGILIKAGSLLTAFSKLRCPYCGASLMAGGRMPACLISARTAEKRWMTAIRFTQKPYSESTLHKLK